MDVVTDITIRRIRLPYVWQQQSGPCDVHVTANTRCVYFIMFSKNSLYRLLFSDIAVLLRHMAFLPRKVERKKCILFLSPYIILFYLNNHHITGSPLAFSIILQ